MVLEKGEEKTKHWLVVLTFLYGMTTPKFLRMKTGVQRTNAYLSGLVSEGYLIRREHGVYEVNKEKFFNKLLEEIGISFSKDEKEILRKLILDYRIVIEIIRKSLEGIPSMRDLMKVNPYKFFMAYFYNTVYTYFFITIKMVWKEWRRKLLEDEDVKQMVEEIRKHSQVLEKVFLEKIEDRMTKKVINGVMNIITEKGVSTEIIEVIKGREEEFKRLVDYFEENLEVLEKMLTKIKNVLEKDVLFKPIISFSEAIAQVIQSILTLFKESILKEIKETIIIPFYKELLSDLERE